MSSIAIIFIIIGIVIAVFGNMLLFKPLKKYIKNENLKEYDFDNKEEDEDFTILINMTKKVIYYISLIFIFIGIIIYLFFCNF